MLGEVFYWVFNMSIVASLMGFVVLLIGKIRKLPRRLIFILWAIPFLRLWIPVGLGSNFGLMPLISKVTSRTIVLYKGVTSLTMTNSTMAASSYFPIRYKTHLIETIFNVSSIVWIIVCLSIFITLFTIYAVTKKELRGAVHLKDNIYLSDKITSPAVYGVFRSKIILPAQYAGRDLTFVLAHENAHIRRADNLWRVVAFVTVAIHWFNPVAWVFLRNFLSDLELSCDERVLSNKGEKEKRAYALALVDSAESRNAFISAFGGAKIRMRIDNILSYRKISVLSSLCLISLAVAIAYVLLTNPL